MGWGGGMMDDSAEIFFQSFLQEALVSSSGMGKDVHFLMLSIQHFLCRPRHHPPSQGALEDDFGEAVVACNLPEPCEFPYPDSCQKNFLGVRREVDFAQHPVVTGLVLQVERYGEVSSGTWFLKSGSFSQSQQAGSIFLSQR